jgi:hypothetical protein
MRSAVCEGGCKRAKCELESEIVGVAVSVGVDTVKGEAL